jgi:hypothetical protein
MEDRGTPLLYVAQKGSPQVDPKSASYIDGLVPGMAFNNLTGESWDAENTGVSFLPCFHRVNWVQWTPRESGGGFRGMHPRMEPDEVERRFSGRQREGRRDIFELPDGDELVLTHHYFGLIATTMAPIIVPMSSTNLKASQQMQQLIGSCRAMSGGQVLTLPGYFIPYSLRTVYAQNDQGTWYRWAPRREGSVEDQSTWTPPEVRAVCKEFALLCARNEVQIAQPIQQDEGSSGDANVPI